jgi:hypothetical protein
MTMHHSRHIIALLMAAAMAVPAAFTSGGAADPTRKLVTEHFMIDAAKDILQTAASPTARTLLVAFRLPS